MAGLVAAACGHSASASDFAVAPDATDNTAKTVSGTDTGTVGTGGKLSVNKKAAIDWNDASTDLRITNSGTIVSTKPDGHAIDASGSDNARSLTLENKKGATLDAEGDTVRINVNPTGGTVNVTNSGTIKSTSKRALNFEAATSGAAAITITNTATGTITSHSDDAIRPGQGATINNSGTIRTDGEAANKADGIDFKDATAGTVNNNDSGTISGARHGITLSGNSGAGSVTVNNAANATITGRSGSGVGSDAGGTVTNYGTIEGAYSGNGTEDGDGDGVDIDYAGTITNLGTIKGTGAGGYDKNGRANNSEGISIGGGTITNSGTISGAAYGIVVNNDSNPDNSRSGVAATTITNGVGGTIEGKGGYAIRLENKLGTAADDDTITNRGTIIGNGTIPDPTAVVTLRNGSVDGGSVGTLDGVHYTGTGSARFIKGDGAAIQMGEGNDTLNNYGTITGNSGRAISLEGGNDTLNLYTGSTITGRIDGGTDTDTINLDKESGGPSTGTLANVINFESVNVKGGTWKLLDDQTYVNGATIAAGATLRVGDGATSGSITADIANNGALVFDRTDATSYAGTISGSGSLTKVNTGTLTLSTAHSYTGTTTVSGGVLNIRNAAALGSADGTAATGTTVASGAALELQGGIAVGNEALSLAGTGVGGGGALRNISGDNSYAGAITLTDAARIASDAGTLTLSGAISGAAGATRNLTLGGAGDGVVSGAISGNIHQLMKDGAGTWTLTGTSTLDSSVTVDGGALRLAGGGSVSDFAAVIGSQSGLTGSVTVTGANSRWASSGDLYVGFSGTGTLTVADGGSVSNLDANIGRGSGSTGSATVTGANSRWASRGNFTIGDSGAGTLTVTDGGSVSAGTNGLGLIFVTRRAGSAGTLNIGAAAGQTASAAGTVKASEVRFGSGTGTLVFNHTGNPDGSAVTFAPKITGAGSLSHRAGTTILTGANTYTGATTVSGGTLTLGNATALGAADGTAANGTTVAAGASLALQGGITGGIAVGNEALSIAGSGVGAGGALRNLSGDNSYAGAITLTDAARIGADAGTLTLSGAISGAAGADRNLTLGGAGNGVVAGAVSGNIGGLTKDGAGTWTLTGSNTLGGDVTVDGGALRLAGGGSVQGQYGYIGYGSGTTGSATVTGANSSWASSYDLYVGFSGTGTLTVADGGRISDDFATIGVARGTTGSAIVTGADSSWTSSRTLYVGDSGTGTLAVADGGTVAVGGGTGTLTIARYAGSTGTLVVGAAAGQSAVAAGTVSAGTVKFGSGTGTLVFNHTGNPDGTAVTFAPTITGAGSLSHLAGTTALTGASTYTGATTVSGGMLILGNATALGAADGTAATGTTVAAGASLALQGGIAVGNEALSIAGRGVSDAGALRNISGTNSFAGAITLTRNTRINSDAGTLTLSGAISGASGLRNLTLGGASDGLVSGSVSGNIGGLTKDGAGTWTLTGASTLVGNVTVDGGALRLAGGGSVSSIEGYISYNSGTTGSAIVTGANSSWTNNGNLYVGVGGTGTLTVADGGSVSDSFAYIGANASVTGNATGNAAVTGANSRWASQLSLYVGHSGTGTLAVAEGGTVAVGTNGTGTLTIAKNAGSIGTLIVGAAAGQTPAAAGTVQAGEVHFGAGTGTLVFNHTGNPDGTAVTFAPTITGGGSLSHLAGTTILTGANTYTGATTVSGGTLTLGNATALGAADGTAATGTTVAAGATLALQGGIAVGNEALSLTGIGVNADGALRNVSGDNSYAGAIILTDRTNLINTDAGTLTLSGAISGTAGAVHDLTLGGKGDGIVSNDMVGNIGDLYKVDIGKWTLKGQSTLSSDAIVDGGALQLETGGNLSGAYGYVGLSTASSGSMTVTGTGSSWTQRRSLYIGDAGAGTLTVAAGGFVSTTQKGYVGYDSGSSGSATVTGAGSSWTVSGDLFVGYQQGSTGTLAVVDGGTVSVGTSGTGTLTIADQAGSTGSLIVGAAAGQTASAAGTVQAGTVAFGSGIGTLVFNHTGNPDGTALTFAPTITGGGSLSHLAGTTVLTGANTYTGTTTVSGGTLTLGNAAALGAADGTAANGTTVASGASLALQGGIAVGNEALSIAGGGVSGGGALRNVSGANSYAGAITLTNAARIGSDAGTLTLSGAISGVAGADRNLTLGGAGDGVVSGAISGNIGNLVKDEAGSWTLTGQDRLSGEVRVDSGALMIAAGGRVSNAVSNIGSRTGSSGAATVTGAGSSWANTSSFVVGLNGTGTLTIQAGGRVSDAYSVLGYAAGTSGTATVTGTDSAWTDGTHYVGLNGTGTLTIQAGGKVSDAAGFLGSNTGSSGAATVTGAGSTWTNTGQLSVGAVGSGALAVADGGLVSVGSNGTGTLTIARYAGSTGAVIVGSAPGDPAVAAGTVQAGTVAFGSGIGTLVFNHTGNPDGSAVTFAPTITGAGSLSHRAGTTILTGANSYTGTTTISGGTLSAANATALGGSAATVAPGGTLDVNGVTLTNALTLSGAGAGGVGALTGTGTAGVSGPIALAGNATLGGSGTLTVSGAIGDGGNGYGLSKLGTGTTALTGANSYTGATTVSAGTLALTGAGSIAASSGVALATGAAFDISGVTGAGATIASLTDTAPGQAGTVALGAKTLTLTNAGGRFGGTVSGSGGLTLAGGTQTLAGANSYIGATTITGGTLSAANATALGSSAATISGGGTLDVNGVTIANALTLSGTGAGGVGALTGTGMAGVTGPITLAGTATLGGSGTLTVSGTIDDGGAGYGLSKTGTGTAVLTVANTYAGGTTVTGGTLALSGAGNLGSARATTTIAGATSVLDLGGTRQSQAAVSLGQGATLQNGALDAPVTAAGGTLARISGPATLTTTGGTTLSTANTYTGATMVGDGSVLKAGGADGFSAASAYTLAGSATLDLAGAANTVGALAGASPAASVTSSAGPAVLTVAGLGAGRFAGTIRDGTGPLGLTLSGDTLTLTGANTYTGATTIGRGATLRLGDGGTAGALTATSGVTDDGTLVFDRADLTRFAPAISGSGGLIQAGSGTTVLTGRNTYTGATTISGGTLQIDGVLAASEVTVKRGGTLAGSGKIGDPLIEAGGRLAPGSATAIGTLSIYGPLTFAASSFYTVKVTPTANDRTAVTGPVTIQGGTVQVLAGEGTYTPALRYTLLTATGGVTGRFSSLQTTSNLAFLTPSLSYDRTSVALGFAQTAPIASVATTANQGSVAQALNGAGPTVTTSTTGTTTPAVTTSVSAGGTVTTTVSTASGTTTVSASPAAQVTTAVLNQTAPGAVRALNSLSGEIHASAVSARAQAALAVQGTLLERLRFGTGPASGLGLSGAVGQRFAPGTTLPAGYAALTPEEPAPGLVAVRPLVPGYGLWGQAFGAFGATEATRNVTRLTRQTGGFVFGAETGPDVLGDGLGDGRDGWRVGVAAGYGFTQFDVRARQSSGRIESGFGAAYASGALGPVRVRLGAVYGGDALDTHRTVLFPGFSQAISGRTGGTMLQGFGEVSCRIGEVTRYVEPFVGAAALRLHGNGFSETGGSAALGVFGRSYWVGTATAGVQVQAIVADLFGGAGPLVVRGLIGYRRAFGDVAPAALLAFRGAGTAFRTAGAPLAEDAAVASAGLDWAVGPSTSVGLAYDGQLGRRAQDHAVKGSLSYRW